jgi:O-antigen/teichoic acid export membrane protein
MAGTGLSQLLTIASSPILTRLYNPFEFGKLAFFMSACALISIFSTGRYELAIMLPKNEKTAFNLLIFVIALSLCLNSSLLIIFFFVGDYLLSLINNPITYSSLLLIPFGSFFISIFQGINFWLNRQNEYNLISASRIAQSTSTLLLSIVIGFLGYKSYGLISGFIIGTITSIFPLYKILTKHWKLFSIRHIVGCSKIYISYPKFMMPTAFMDTFAMQAPIFFITKFFNSIVVGAYSLAFRIVTAPMALISGAIGQVYFQKITSLVNNNIKLNFTLIKTTKILSLISFFIFLPFLTYGSKIFEFVFGLEWAVAGEYVEIISFAMIIRFVVSPLSTIFISTNNLKLGAFWQILYFFTTIIMFYFGRDLDINKLLWLYVGHEIILYSIYFILMMYVTYKFDKKILCAELAV